MVLLRSKLGFFIYQILRNDWVWNLLKPKEKDLVIAANNFHNVHREDYVDVADYGGVRMLGGETWDSTNDRWKSAQGKSLKKFLDDYRPKHILEIGPGGGFFSKEICERNHVEQYTALDINPHFLDYLKPRLEEVKKRKTSFKFNLINDTIEGFEKSPQYDSVILLSTVHHIPNRQELFDGLEKCLNNKGTIFCFDPCHYLLRWRDIVKNFLFGEFKGRLFLKKEKFLKVNISTHHFCTYGEYKTITKRNPSLKIDQVSYVFPNKFKFLNGIKFQNIFRVLSYSIAISLKVVRKP